MGHRAADVRRLQALATCQKNPPRRVMFRVRSSLAQDFEQTLFCPQESRRIGRVQLVQLCTFAPMHKVFALPRSPCYHVHSATRGFHHDSKHHHDDSGFP